MDRLLEDSTPPTTRASQGSGCAAAAAANSPAIRRQPVPAMKMSNMYVSLPQAVASRRRSGRG